jgi:RNA polymerase sigma-70 factor (ECF subfamily)
VIPNDARGAWQELEERLRPYVARRVASVDVDDVVQDVFARMHRGIGGLRDGERFGGWVYGIARRAIADHARAGARHPLAPAGQADATPAEPQPVEDEELQAGLAECVARFVASLPSPYREAVTLTALEGLSQKDAAELLGISLSGMKSRVQRGRDKLRKMFEDCCAIALDGRGRVTQCDPRPLHEVGEPTRACFRRGR